jgi:phosphoenolpyruvate carboxylase
MDYPNRGTLWVNSYKKTDVQPDMKGDIKLELDLVKELLANAESDHVVIKLSAWLGKDKDGNRKVSLQFDNYKPAAPAASSAKDPWDD